MFCNKVLLIYPKKKKKKAQLCRCGQSACLHVREYFIIVQDYVGWPKFTSVGHFDRRIEHDHEKILTICL